jgi:hypothetical protein
MIIDRHLACGPAARTEAQCFGTTQARHGPLRTVPGLAQPVSRARVRAATPARRAAWPGTELEGRPATSPQNSTHLYKEAKIPLSTLISPPSPSDSYTPPPPSVSHTGALFRETLLVVPHDAATSPPPTMEHGPWSPSPHHRAPAHATPPRRAQTHSRLPLPSSYSPAHPRRDLRQASHR